MKQLFIIIIICLPFFQTLTMPNLNSAQDLRICIFLFKRDRCEEGILRVENPDNENDPSANIGHSILSCFPKRKTFTLVSIITIIIRRS